MSKVYFSNPPNDTLQTKWNEYIKTATAELQSHVQQKRTQREQVARNKQLYDFFQNANIQQQKENTATTAQIQQTTAQLQTLTAPAAPAPPPVSVSPPTPIATPMHETTSVVNAIENQNNLSSRLRTAFFAIQVQSPIPEKGKPLTTYNNLIPSEATQIRTAIKNSLQASPYSALYIAQYSSSWQITTWGNTVNTLSHATKRSNTVPDQTLIQNFWTTLTDTKIPDWPETIFPAVDGDTLNHPVKFNRYLAECSYILWQKRTVTGDSVVTYSLSTKKKNVLYNEYSEYVDALLDWLVNPDQSFSGIMQQVRKNYSQLPSWFFQAMPWALKYKDKYNYAGIFRLLDPDVQLDDQFTHASQKKIWELCKKGKETNVGNQENWKRLQMQYIEAMTKQLDVV